MGALEEGRRSRVPVAVAMVSTEGCEVWERKAQVEGGSTLDGFKKPDNQSALPRPVKLASCYAQIEVGCFGTETSKLLRSWRGAGRWGYPD